VPLTIAIMTFSDLNLNRSILNALDDLGLVTPTTIQHKGFSPIMSGADIVGIAQTGTGKTIAYLLPCLRMWQYSKDKQVQILILVPTRELVVQVAEEVEKLAKYLNVTVVGVYGGGNINTQASQIKQGVDVLVATPGRFLDLVLNNALKLKSVKRLVIDEVDEMLDLGFRTQLTRVLDLLPNNRQNLMFSATMTKDVAALIQDFFKSPKIIEAAPTGTPLENILQLAYPVANFFTKINLLHHLLTSDVEMKKVLVFVATKKQADLVYETMVEKMPESIGIIHSNRAQNVRFEAVKLFKNGTNRVLIATDIVARGLDISEVSHVINFDMPEESENYIHRIGRTGRADKDGIAISFVTKAEKENQANVEALMNKKIKMKRFPANVNKSDVLLLEEQPLTFMKIVTVKQPNKELAGPSFHEKSKKNTKVNVIVKHKDRMMAKYGRPKTRGQKPPKKRK
jgi:ATP-dependent RNA helicase RhlE